MKRVRAFLSFILIMGLCLNAFPVSKAAGSDWTISDVKATHTGITFTISNYDGTSSAFVVVTTRSENKEICRIPVTISGSGPVTANPEGGLKADVYSWYVEDSTGEKSKARDLLIDKHSYTVSNSHAYPTVFTGTKDQKNAEYSVIVIINGKEYKATLEGEVFTATYPEQALGTPVQVKVTDGYGCDYTQKLTIENKSIKMPTVDVYHGYAKIAFSTDNLSPDERMCATVNGKDYYGKYGATNMEKAIEYDDNTKKGDKITLWVESKLGGTSKKTEYEIKDCDLKDCVYNVTVGSKKAVGTVAADPAGHIPVDVSIVVKGKEYHVAVGEGGRFVLEYPELKDAFEVDLTFTDKHGCKYEKDFLNDGATGDLAWDIIVSYDFASAIVSKGTRICVTLSSSGKTYFSDYCESDYGEVMVKFPETDEDDDITVWAEDDVGNSQKKEKYSPSEMYRKYKDYSVSTSNIRSKSGDDEDYGSELIESDETLKSVFVIIGEKRFDGTVDDGNKGTFHVDFDKQPIGTKFTLHRVFEKEGERISDTPTEVEQTRDFYINNIPPKFKVSEITSDSQYISGTTAANAKITAKVSGKSYSAKSDSSGKFKIKIKKAKSGAVFNFKVECENGMYGHYIKRVVAASGFVSIVGYVLKTSKKVTVKLTNASKGNKVVLKIGNKTYSQKLKSKKKTVTFSVSGLSTWQKISVNLLDSFGKKKDHCNDRVYYSNDISVGMSATNVQRTTWGPPVRKNNWAGLVQWVFERGGSIIWVYISGGKVSRIDKYNY